MTKYRTELEIAIEDCTSHALTMRGQSMAAEMGIDSKPPSTQMLQSISPMHSPSPRDPQGSIPSNEHSDGDEQPEYEMEDDEIVQTPNTQMAELQ